MLYEQQITERGQQVYLDHIQIIIQHGIFLQVNILMVTETLREIREEQQVFHILPERILGP